MYLKVFCALLGFVATSGGATDKLHQDKFAVFDEPQQAPTNFYHYGESSPFSEPQENQYHKSWKTLRSEKYETKTVDNPYSDNPGNKYIVKSSVKVREKLPFEETTLGYDHEYEYPISEIDHDFHKNEKVVDFNNQKNDPFPNAMHQDSQVYQEYQVPKVSFETKKGKKKPKEYHYEYKYPSVDYEFNSGINEGRKKPKSYSYKYPQDDLEYLKNVNSVEHYLKKLNPEAVGDVKEQPKKSADSGYNDVEYDLLKNDKYENSNYDPFGPSEEEIYQKYKTDGYGFK